MFLGNMIFKNGQYDYYELFHHIVSDFKYKHYLTIIKIQSKDDELEYYFERNKDKILGCWYQAKLSFIHHNNSATVKLETPIGTFDEFSNMYKDLKKIGEKYIDENKDKKIEMF